MGLVLPGTGVLLSVARGRGGLARKALALRHGAFCGALLTRGGSRGERMRVCVYVCDVCVYVCAACMCGVGGQ